MIVAKVVGSAVASLKHEQMRSTKLLLVSQADALGQTCGLPFLAVDLVGAGQGEYVIVSQGSSARLAAGQNASPVDAAIVGILDSLAYDGDEAFRKE